MMLVSDALPSKLKTVQKKHGKITTANLWDTQNANWGEKLHLGTKCSI